MNLIFKRVWNSANPLKTLTSLEQSERLIKFFVRRVNTQAEQNMLKTGKLEGAHHSAMKQQLKEWGIEL